ncbi:efflux RND transporter periplasmic adaptor subunit [soil metagenome]
MIANSMKAAFPLALTILIAACGGGVDEAPNTTNTAGEASEKSAPGNVVTLTIEQIQAAGIQIARPSIGGSGGAIDLPATIESDPQGIQIVSAAIGGRVVTLSRNLGEAVRRGDTLAVIESREAAQLRGDIEGARARSALAQSNLRREQRLFAERVSPEQDLIAARTAATEASIALRQAQQQLSAAGFGGGALNRIALPSPINGQIIARSVTLGQTVAADAELYRVANLDRLSLSVSLAAADAGQIKAGTRIEVTAPGRRGEARVTFVSPVLDGQTRQVPVIATLDNGNGRWRVGESIRASIQLPGRTGSSTIAIPQVALQTIAGKAVVFVRTKTGFRAMPVTPGPANGNQVTILEGLTGSEQIAATNSFTLKAELGKSAGGED